MCRLRLRELTSRLSKFEPPPKESSTTRERRPASAKYRAALALQLRKTRESHSRMQVANVRGLNNFNFVRRARRGMW